MSDHKVSSATEDPVEDGKSTAGERMESAPRDGTQILAWCDHEAGVEYEEPEPGEPITRSLYEAHGDGLGYATTGFHIVEWGGGFDDSTHENPDGAYLPDWWFVAGSEFEVAANPVMWWQLPPAPAASSPTPDPVANADETKERGSHEQC